MTVYSPIRPLASNSNPRVGELPEIVNVQDRAVHDTSLIPDSDTVGTGVDVNLLIEVNPASQPDEAGKPQPHPVLNCCGAVHPKDQAIQDPTQPKPDHRGDPADQSHHELLE